MTRRVVLLALLLPMVGLAVLALHPLTGAEVRAFIRDRYLRRGAELG